MPERSFMRHLPVVILGVLGLVITAVVIWQISDDTDAVDLFSEAGCNVPVIGIEGPIDTTRTEGLIHSFDIALEIEHQASNPDTVAILLLIDSVGGSASGAQEIVAAVDALEVPVATLVRGAALSGGYWIAAATDYVVARPATAIGSIGATASYLDETQLNEQEGYTFQEIVSGAYKEVGNVNKPLTAEGRAFLEGYTEDIFELFAANVQQYRNLSNEQMEVLSDAKFYLAQEALSLGLIDALGDWDEVQGYLADTLDIAPDQVVFCDPLRYEPYVGSAE